MKNVYKLSLLNLISEFQVSELIPSVDWLGHYSDLNFAKNRDLANSILV